MTREQFIDTIAKAIHEEGCGGSEMSNEVGCGALDMHVDSAVAVVAELEGLGVVHINGQTEQAHVSHLGDQ